MYTIKSILIVTKRTSLLVSNFRLYSRTSQRIDLLFHTHNNKHRYNIHKGAKQFSLQSSIESLVRTQTGIFKTVSESTPVEFLKTCLVTMHDTSGLPWWATIVCTTIALRTIITLPFAVYQNYILAKFENLHLEMPDIIKELKKEMAVAIRMYNWDERTAKLNYNRTLRKQWNNLIVRDNCHPMKAGVLLLFQIPTWICFSVSLRNMAYMLPVQDASAQIIFLEMSVGGFSWIPNLIAADSTLILPITLGLVNLTIIETLSKVKVPTKVQLIVTNLFRCLCIFMIPVAATVPSCLTLYWTTSSVYGLIQNLVLMSPRVRRFCCIPKTASELEQPYKHVLTGFRHKIGILR